jgi:hypothetical protein
VSSHIESHHTAFEVLKDTADLFPYGIFFVTSEKYFLMLCVLWNEFVVSEIVLFYI